MESTWAPHQSIPSSQELTYRLQTTFEPSPTYSFPVQSDSLLIIPHSIISITLTFPYQNPIHTHTLIDSGSQSSLISNSFSCYHSLTQDPLNHPIPIHGLDSNPLSDGLISHAVSVNLHIQNHSEHITLGVINMNYDVLLGIDWL